MSTWRDIWRYGVIANRLYAESEERGEKAFDKLMEVYDRPEKDGKSRQDGMIRYIKAEAYERKYWETNKEEYREKALKNYKSAENLFPVEHWKAVARETYQRLSICDSPESFYNTRNILSYKIYETEKYEEQFKKYIRYGFQKTYEFVNLNDFGRYVCLSSLSRGPSEWPLSLIDFRTVLELEIKQCFPEVLKGYYFKLEDAINYLGKNIFENDEQSSFDNIRKAGNKATHDPGVLDPKFKIVNISNFIKVLSFFNDYRKNSNIDFNTEKIPSPLRQMSLDDFQRQLDKEKSVLMENNYYN